MDYLEEIQAIKDKVGNQAEDIIASGLNLRKHGKKYNCPNISQHKNNDKDPSLSWDNNLHQFKCFACSLLIDIYGYYKDYLNYTHQEVVRDILGDTAPKDSIATKRNSFNEEARKVTDINKECMDYINLRGITEKTVKHFNIGTYKGLIAFPYYKNHTLIGYKTRKPIKNPSKPKMLNITGSKPYLYNAQNIKKEETELIICEGEFDCMVIHQCGYENVVSVGAGANSLSSLMEQADEFIKQFDALIIVSDNDDAGNSMDAEFLKLFGDKAKIIDKKLYKRNDINEEYIINGKEQVEKIIQSARHKIEGERFLESDPYKGVTNKGGVYVPTGIESIDYALNDLAPKCTTLITGRSNDGKTTFVTQIMANAIDKGHKVFLMSGEGNQELFLNSLYMIVIGRSKDNYNLVKENKRYVKEPTAKALKKLQAWHYKKLALFNRGDSKLKTLEQLLSYLTLTIKSNRYNLVVIDNLMSILSVKASEKYEQQADFMQELHHLAETYDTHIILVLHPNKTYKKGTDMDFEQISGTSDLYNKADNIIAVTRFRPTDEDNNNYEQGIHGKISVLKSRYYSELPSAKIHFDAETKLLLEIKSSGNIGGYTFNWDKEAPSELNFVDTPEGCPF